MSMGYRGKTTNLPRENVAVQAQAERESQWGTITGEVVSFDPATQTAKIKPDYKPVHDGKEVDMPELEEVPVRFHRAGGFVVTTPVKPGDKMELRPQMRSSENYHEEGEYKSGGDTRSMSLSDMEAYPIGGESLKNPISNFNNENFEVRSADGSAKIEMSEDGKFRFLGAQGNWFDLVAQLAEKLGTETTLVHRAEYEQIGQKLRSMAL